MRRIDRTGKFYLYVYTVFRGCRAAVFCASTDQVCQCLLRPSSVCPGWLCSYRSKVFDAAVLYCKSRGLVQILQVCQGIGIPVDGMNGEAFIQQVAGIATSAATNVHGKAASGPI